MLLTHSTQRSRRGAERRELRAHFRARRRDLDAAAQALHGEAVARHFFASPWALRGRTVGLYLAADGELDTGPLLDRLLTTRKRLALPVVGRRGRMDFFRLRRLTPLSVNRYGILEPAPGAAWVAPLSIDLVFMPLVAFDRFGVRLGMGAGFYDRYLGDLPATLRPRLVGVAHDVQYSLDPLPFDTWDVPLDAVITESGWHTFDAER